MADKTGTGRSVHEMLGRIEFKDLGVLKKPGEWCELGGSSCFPVIFRLSTWWVKHSDCSVPKRDSDSGGLTCCSSKHWHAGHHAVRTPAPSTDLESSCHRKLDTIEPTSPDWSQYQSIIGRSAEWIRSVGTWPQCWETPATSPAFPKPASRAATNQSGQWES